MRRTILALSGLLSFACLAQDNELSEFSAYYRANTNGLRGNAERHLVKQADNLYRLNISLEAKVIAIKIGTLEQSSEFAIEDGVIKPHNYNYRVTGVTRENQSVDFDWDEKVALSSEDEQHWSLDIEPGVLDQLSYQAALVLELNKHEDQEFEFQLVDGNEIETHLYRVIGAEKLDTPLGSLNTTKLERVREEGNGRQTFIWFADDWDYLLARIEQINPGGLRIELELENALVGGQQVTPLSE